MAKEKIPKKKGRKPKYLTDEERRQGERDRSKKYYDSHKELCLQKQHEKYKQKSEILKKYNEGKFIEIV